MSTNPFKKFELKTKKIKVKELDNAFVTIQEMTVEKSTDYYKRLFSAKNTNGEPILNQDELLNIKFDKISEFMIEPKMTVEELKALGASANNAINAINDEIDALSSGN